jgi:hypothetical protein
MFWLCLFHISIDIPSHHFSTYQCVTSILWGEVAQASLFRSCPGLLLFGDEAQNWMVKPTSR